MQAQISTCWPQPQAAFNHDNGLQFRGVVRVARLQSEFCTKDFFRATNFLTKNVPNFPRKFWAFVLWVRKNPGKFPPNFPLNFPNFPAKKSTKNSPTSFCRSAGRRSRLHWIFLNFLLIFALLFRLTLQFGKEITQNVGKIALLPDGEKSVQSCHVSGCDGAFPSSDSLSLSKTTSRNNLRK